MPLTNKGQKIMRAMKQEYGGKKGEQVFYASKNKGVISGVEKTNPGHITITSGNKITHRKPISFNKNSLPKVFGGKY